VKIKKVCNRAVSMTINSYGGVLVSTWVRNLGQRVVLLWVT